MARVYHFCQRCKQLISPRINDDAFKEQQQELNATLHLVGKQALLPPTGHHVWTHECPKCGHGWPLTVLRIGRAQLDSLVRMVDVKSQLQVQNTRGRVVGQDNYKQLQRANCYRSNPIGAGPARARRKRYVKQLLEGADI